MNSEEDEFKRIEREALRRAQAAEDDDTQVYADTLTIVYQRGFADGKKAVQQAEPVAFYSPTKGFYWAKPTKISAPTIVDVPPIALYAEPPQQQPVFDCPRCGHVCSQRPWQGLTEDEAFTCKERNI